MSWKNRLQPEFEKKLEATFAFFKSDAVYMSWLNNSGGKIVITQNVLSGDNLFNNEDSSFQIIYHDNMKIAYTNKFNVKTFLWNTHGYAFSLTIIDTITYEECVTLIESVTKYNH